MRLFLYDRLGGAVKVVQMSCDPHWCTTPIDFARKPHLNNKTADERILKNQNSSMLKISRPNYSVIEAKIYSTFQLAQSLTLSLSTASVVRPYFLLRRGRIKIKIKLFGAKTQVTEQQVNITNSKQSQVAYTAHNIYVWITETCIHFKTLELHIYLCQTTFYC